MPDIHQITYGQITCHSFNKERDHVAICPGDHTVQIYKKSGPTWVLSTTLSEHDKLVTSIDWAPNSNRIVSCSQDRNAYVWKFETETQTWKPTLVLLRINRAATAVKWSPKEDKFAVASGARLISICYFDEEYDWWTSKHIKKPIRSTVLSLDWHPDNILIAAGAADSKARIYSAFIKGVDKKVSSPVWGEKLTFGTLCAEYTNGNGGWVHGVAFSPDGNLVAWCGHDSTLSIGSPSLPEVLQIKLPALPATNLFFTSNSMIVATGYDCIPYVFKNDEMGKWELTGKIDQGGKKSDVGAGTALNKFRQMDTRAQIASSAASQTDTLHQNTITSLAPYEGGKDNIVKFSTSGMDGKIIIWEINDAVIIPVKDVLDGVSALKI